METVENGEWGSVVKLHLENAKIETKRHTTGNNHKDAGLMVRVVYILVK